MGSEVVNGRGSGKKQGDKKAVIRLVPLGGLGEVGKNMMVIEYGEDIVIVDAGLMFPEAEMLGVDLVIPDTGYLHDKLDRIRALIITHGHEDHIGGLPYVLPMLGFPPVYATKLTRGLIEVKLKEHHLQNQVTITTITTEDHLELGTFGVEFFRVNHSIPDAVGVIIRTPLGTLVHTGDYKFDYTPVDGLPADFGALARIGQEGVLALMGDSTRAESPGYTPSERVINDTLDKLFANAPGRIILATFASLISRIQQVVDTAVRYDRRVALVGRTMISNAQMAQELGYLNIPEGTLVRPEEMFFFEPQQITIICTGSQGEPTSALTRMANGDHKIVRVQPGDTVILSATPVPGNEKLVGRNINNLLRQGAEVYYPGVAQVHVSGHGSQEELKLMMNLVRPQFLVPVHGEMRQLVAHAKLGKSLGIPEDHIVIAEDGDIIEVSPEGIRKADHYTNGNVFVDGLGVGDIGSIVMRDRQVLAQDGILMAVLTVDKETGQPISGPDIISRGFIYMRDADELITLARAHVLESFGMHSRNGHTADWTYVKAKIKDTLGDFLYEKTKRRPMILPVVMEV
ncbi:MAG TPA: ribonuclease J [Ktedonobacterales bacterium]|nr:ribonuclease J [Ktedonobacterales bacterium]